MYVCRSRGVTDGACSMNFYNDNDPYVAQWLRNLIAKGLLPIGVVNERSIEDISPAELRGYTQCHFFAGIGGWPLALAIAGIPADYPIWTASCPCQPFSTAGTQQGFDDERHLWPALQWLIEQCEPPTVVGEQVASKDAEPWLDLVCSDLEGMGFAFGAVAFPSAGIGAPHIRDRTYWLGDTDSTRLERFRRGHHTKERQAEIRSASASGQPTRLAFGVSNRSALGLPTATGRYQGQSRVIDNSNGELACTLERSALGRLPDTDQQRCDPAPIVQLPTDTQPHLESYCDRGGDWPRATNGYWSAVDWLACRDGYWRPVEPGSFPLAHGVRNRVGRLRAYGNAINPWQGAEFLACSLS